MPHFIKEAEALGGWSGKTRPPSYRGLKAGFKSTSSDFRTHTLAVVNRVTTTKNTCRKVLCPQMPKRADNGAERWSSPDTQQSKEKPGVGQVPPDQSLLTVTKPGM